MCSHFGSCASSIIFTDKITIQIYEMFNNLVESNFNLTNNNQLFIYLSSWYPLAISWQTSVLGKLFSSFRSPSSASGSKWQNVSGPSWNTLLTTLRKPFFKSSFFISCLLCGFSSLHKDLQGGRFSKNNHISVYVSIGLQVSSSSSCSIELILFRIYTSRHKSHTQ